MAIPFIKQYAKRIKRSYSIKHCQALDLISKSLGYKNWNTACALIERMSYEEKKALELRVKEVVFPYLSPTPEEYGELP